MTNKQIERGIRFLEESDHWDTIRDGLIKLLKAMLEPEEKKEDKVFTFPMKTMEFNEWLGKHSTCEKRTFRSVDGNDEVIGHQCMKHGEVYLRENKLKSDPICTVYEEWKDKPFRWGDGFLAERVTDYHEAIFKYCEDK